MLLLFRNKSTLHICQWISFPIQSYEFLYLIRQGGECDSLGTVQETKISPADNMLEPESTIETVTNKIQNTN